MARKPGYSDNKSFLHVIGNELTCDCRLRWVFELSKNTKNEVLREALHRIQCVLQQGNKEHEPIDYFENAIAKQAHSVQDDDAPGYYDENGYNPMLDSVKINSGHLNSVLKMTPEQLPCPQEYSEPTELPLQRESIGLMDLSWRSAANTLSIQITVIFSALLLSCYFRNY